MKRRELSSASILRYPGNMRLLAVTFLLVLCASNVFAGTSDWVELAPDTRVRLISSDRLTPDGTLLAAIELDMPHNTKTYWRVPGETGIGTELDLSRSTGIAAHRLLWPIPEIEELKGYTDFVYYGPTVIPLELELAGERATLDASLLMGICSDICIPATADLVLSIDPTKPDAGSEIRIAQAVAAVPLPWQGDRGPVGAVRFDAATESLLVAVDDAVLDPASLVADGSATGHLFGAPQKSPQPGVVRLPLIGGDAAGGLAGHPVLLIFMTSDGPFELARSIEASTAAGS